jgi:hypothetical protein
MRDMHDDGLGAARGLLVAMALAVIGWGLLTRQSSGSGGR